MLCKRAAQQRVEPQVSADDGGIGPRSNNRRTRSTIDSNARGSGTRTSTSSAVPSSWRETAITPGCLSTTIVRR